MILSKGTHEYQGNGLFPYSSNFLQQSVTSSKQAPIYIILVKLRVTDR